jgi:hypothetical protein
MLLIRFPVALRRVIGFLHRRFHHLSQGLALWSVLAESQLELERPGAERFEFGLLAGEEPVRGADQDSEHQGEQEAEEWSDRGAIRSLKSMRCLGWAKTR